MEKLKLIFNSTILFAALFGTWYSFSGFENKFFIVLGIISCSAAVVIALRMSVIDDERHPIYVKWRMPFYFLWLTKEMFLSSIKVAIKVWIPDARISPVLGNLQASQKTPEAKSVYGNSITLTPGTVCTDIKGQTIQVHALTKAGFSTLKEGTMDRKVTGSIG